MNNKYPSTFYELFEGSKDVTLHFPANQNEGGPYWDDAGNLDLSKCDEDGAEEVGVVNLEGGRYRLAEKGFGPFSSLLLNWGDEFIARETGTGDLELLSVATPAKFKHYQSIGGGPFSNESSLAELIHRCGGGWETVAMGLLTISIPVDKVDEYERESS